jgi:hypothetical protein
MCPGNRYKAELRDRIWRLSTPQQMGGDPAMHVHTMYRDLIRWAIKVGTRCCSPGREWLCRAILTVAALQRNQSTEPRA